MKALLVEDDKDQLDVTSMALRREGHTVLAVSDGQEALRMWETDRPDIVLLDANLPRLNGFEVCRRIRHESRTPVIMLSGRHDEEDKLRGLQLGADDYVLKPFSAKELSARMDAIVRRYGRGSAPAPDGVLRVGDLMMDERTHEVRFEGRPIKLTVLEFRILFALASNAGRVVPFDALVHYGWGYDRGDSSLLKTHICHIRKKLGSKPNCLGDIKAAASLGYRMVRD